MAAKLRQSIQRKLNLADWEWAVLTGDTSKGDWHGIDRDLRERYGLGADDLWDELRVKGLITETEYQYVESFA
jgi:hypothetical protein